MIKLPKVLAFDLDGTLSPSKTHLQNDMSEVFSQLLNFIPMIVVSGASQEQINDQFIKFLPNNSNFSNLYVFPENGGVAVVYKDNEWQIKYENNFSESESKRIIEALTDVVKSFGLIENPEYGKLIENRGSQITLSALGQQAPLSVKQDWDSDEKKRMAMKDELDKVLSDFEVHIGGATSIDITKKRVDKAHALYYALKMLNIQKEELLYFGDAIFPGGNDEIVLKNGFPCEFVHNPEETLNKIRDILHSYEETHRQ